MLSCGCTAFSKARTITTANPSQSLGFGNKKNLSTQYIVKVKIKYIIRMQKFI